MVKIKLKMDPKDRTDIFLPTDTLIKVLQRFGVQEDAKSYLLDGVRIAENDFDKELREIGISESALLTRKEQQEDAEEEEMAEMKEPENEQLRPGPMPNLFSEKGSMPEAVICGTSAGVFSGIPLETWKKMLANEPESGLDDENGDPLFRVAVDEGPGSINEHGVVFSDIPSGKGYACVTLLLDPMEPDKRRLLLAKVGKALLRLIRLESGLRGWSEEETENMTVASRVRTL